MALQLTATDDLVRVDPQTGRIREDQPGGGPESGGIHLKAAANEYVSFQVHVHGAGRKAIGVAFRDLKGGKARIPKREFTYCHEYCIKCGDTWIPDALVPSDAPKLKPTRFAEENGVPRQAWRSIWIDLFVPRGTPGGEYLGEVEIKAAGSKETLLVKLTVYSFAIPDKTSVQCIMNNYFDCISPGFPELGDDPDRYRKPLYREVEKNVYRMAHEHRMVFDMIPYTHSGYSPPTFTPELTGDGKTKRVKSWRDFDRHYGGYFDGSAFKGTKRGEIPVPRFWLQHQFDWPASYLKWGRKGYKTEFVNVGREIVRHFKQKGWTKTTFDLFLNHKQGYKFFHCDAEETRFVQEQTEHVYYNDLWSKVYRNARPLKFAFTYGTTWTYHLDVFSHMADFVDVWVGSSQGPVWMKKRCQELRKRGGQIWYTSAVGSIEAPPVAKAWWPLRTWILDLDAHLPWMSLSWGGDPWKPSGRPGNTGAVNVFYPGGRFGISGPIASVRVKTERNAMQLVERLEIASKRAGGKAKIKHRAASLIGMKLSDWYSPTPTALFKKDPATWRGADWATAGSPPASSAKVSAAQWRRLRDGIATYIDKNRKGGRNG